MAISSTIYRVALELSDVDRGVYETLAFRVACHPSESTERLVARILAYALLYEEGLEFGKGLSEADEPALSTHDLTGQLQHWIDVGTPAADRIHAAAKKAPRVSIVCHKPPEALVREMSKRKLHRAEEIDVLLLPPALVGELAAALERDSHWTIVQTEGELNVTLHGAQYSGSVQRIALPQ